MGTKSILMAVEDPQALVEATQALGHGWEVTSASGEEDALAQLDKRAFDALLVDFNLGSPDASQLLNQALEKRPETSRFLLAYEADLALVAAYVLGPHEILPKPLEPVSLKSRIESGVARDDSACNQSAGAPGTGASVSPAVPAIYSEVLKALESPGVTNSQVGEIIAGDTALTSEVLRLTNSAYLGLPRNITDPAEAVETLGLETVKALVMALRFLGEHSHLRPGYLSFEKLWEHSTNVAQLARDLILFETRDRALAAEALVAGLLHDLGKVVLASNFGDLYGRVHSLARKQPVPLWEIEKEMFGASHGEIGACLVGMWNMPGPVVQAAAHHHEPPLGEYQHLTPLAAVHIANVLEHENRPSGELRVAPIADTAFLNEIGLLQRLPVWRAAFANRWAAGGAPQAEPAEIIQPPFTAPQLSDTPPPRTASLLPAPATATRTGTLGQAGSEETKPVVSVSFRSRWVHAGAAAAILCFLALWFETRPPQPVRALMPPPTFSSAPMVTSPAPVPEPAPPAVPEPTAAMDVSEAAPATEAAAEPSPAPALPEPEPTVATAAQVAATNAPPPVDPPAPAPVEKKLPNFRLNGIIYTVGRPAAIVNGQTVYVGDWVNGATVVGIEQSHVTLQVKGSAQEVRLQVRN
jgi:HD-like signal output (HDOD) protein/ActR/RegA family two-component response regulator